MDVLCTACMRNKDSASPSLQVFGTLLRFRKSCLRASWAASFTWRYQEQATESELRTWVKERKIEGKRLLVHAACHGTARG